ncbi:MAG: tetratricopeptide repeat protein [Ruminiclostridium sp.]
MSIFTGIGAVALSSLESIFTNKISKCVDKMQIRNEFRDFDESIIKYIADNIKEEYEKEKMHDYVIKNSNMLEKFEFISEDEKEEFIESFLKKNGDLIYNGRKDIIKCLEHYIGGINEYLNTILSKDTKIIIQKVSKTEDKIINNNNCNTEILMKYFDEKFQVNMNNNRNNIKNYRIPIKNDNFSGRNKEILLLQKGLENNNLVFISGLGGMGKTQIARKVVNILKEREANVIWINSCNEDMLFRELRNVSLYYHLISDSNQDNEVVYTRFISHCEEMKVLLILDGADDIKISTIVERFSFQEAKVLVTTQNSSIDLELFCVVPVNKMLQPEAIEFLYNRAMRRKKLDDESCDVSELAKILNYYPLAIEYACSYINKENLTYREYIKIYEENIIDILKEDINYYTKTAYTAWKISYDKILILNPNAYEVVAICSFIYSDDIPYKDILIFGMEYNSFQCKQILEALLTYSFVILNTDGISMHGITQELIRMHLIDIGDYKKYFDKTILTLNGLLPNRTYNKTDTDIVSKLLKHVIQAVELYDIEMNVKMAELISKVCQYLYVFGQYENVIAFIEKVKMKLIHNEYFHIKMMMNVYLIQAYHYIGKDDKAEQTYRISYKEINYTDCLETLQKSNLIVYLKNALGIIFKDQGNLKEALKLYEECLVLARNNEQIVNILINIGNIYINEGINNDDNDSFEKALYCFNLAKEKVKEDKSALTKILGNIANVLKIQGNYLDSKSIYIEALTLAQEINDKKTECLHLEHIGNCLLNMQQFDEAEKYLDKSWDITIKINLINNKANILFDRGIIQLRKFKLDEAEKLFIQSYEMSCSANYKKGQELCLKQLSMMKNPLSS